MLRLEKQNSIVTLHDRRALLARYDLLFTGNIGCSSHSRYGT